MGYWVVASLLLSYVAYLWFALCALYLLRSASGMLLANVAFLVTAALKVATWRMAGVGAGG